MPGTGSIYFLVINLWTPIMNLDSDFNFLLEIPNYLLIEGDKPKDIMKKKLMVALAFILIILIIQIYLNLDPKESDQEDNSKKFQPVLLKLNDPYQVTNDSAHQENGYIYGDRIVWQDDRNGNWDIYMFDLATGIETQITNDPDYQVEPKLYGEILVWKDLRNHQGTVKNFPFDYNSDIYMYNLTTGIEKQITKNDKCQFSPELYGDKVVWLDYRSGVAQVYLYDITNDQEIKISKIENNCTGCKIFKNTIIWNTKINNSNNLHKYEISTGSVSKIDTKHSIEISDFDFNDNHLVWSGISEDGDNSDIFLYTFHDDNTIQITTNQSCQVGVKIVGQYVLWSDLRNDPDGLEDCGCKTPQEERVLDNWDIYMFDLTSELGNIQQLTISSGSEFLHCVYDTKIVYLVSIKNSREIYLLQFKK
jgi:beta propeller repeat protein